MAGENKITVPCPVCGSIEIESVQGNNGVRGPGYYSYAIRDVCKNCGVHLSPSRQPFSKVENFNSQQQA